jgi:hypothetical protein
MSNTEKNIRIAKLLNISIWDISTSKITVINPTNDGIIIFHPCEDYNQLMPLCFAHDISHERCEDTWSAWCEYHGVSTTNTNPQTALVDCLIEVLEAREKG